MIHGISGMAGSKAILNEDWCEMRWFLDWAEWKEVKGVLEDQFFLPKGPFTWYKSSTSDIHAHWRVKLNLPSTEDTWPQINTPQLLLLVSQIPTVYLFPDLWGSVVAVLLLIPHFYGAVSTWPKGKWFKRRFQIFDSWFVFFNFILLDLWVIIVLVVVYNFRWGTKKLQEAVRWSSDGREDRP